MVRHVRPITNEEGQKLARIGRHPTDAYELHRAMVILQSAQGFTPPYIADMVGYSPDWVRTLIREFNLHGFKMLKPNRKAGGNWKFTQEQKLIRSAILSLPASGTTKSMSSEYRAPPYAATA